MDGALTQMALPVLGIVAAAAATFYVVSFLELSEKSFRDMDEAQKRGAGSRLSLNSKEKRARRKARNQSKN